MAVPGDGAVSDDFADDSAPGSSDDAADDSTDDNTNNDDAGHNTGEDQDQSETDDNSSTPPKGFIPMPAYNSEKEKRQRYEQENKELRQQLETRQTQTRQPETLEEFFDQNPQSALAYIDNQISIAKSAYDADKLEELRETKTNLVARGLLNADAKTSRETTISKVNQEIYKTVPDFDTKRAELVQFARDSGLSEREAEDIFNPGVIGESAARMVKMVSRFHAMANAGKTGKGKEVRQPTKVEAAGNGGFSNNDVGKKQFNKAKETGKLDDWAAVLG